MVSPSQSTWVWANSGSCWWTGRPGVLQSMGWQRVGHDWATELNWSICDSDAWRTPLLWNTRPWEQSYVNNRDSTKEFSIDVVPVNTTCVNSCVNKNLNLIFFFLLNWRNKKWMIQWGNDCAFQQSVSHEKFVRSSRMQSMGSLRVRHDWATSLSLFTFMHWRRKWQPTPVFLPGESQGRGSLVGYSPWGCTESDMTEVT